MSGSETAAIGVDIGGTHVRVGLTRGGVIVRSAAAHTPREGSEAILACVAALHAQVEAPANTPTGVAVAGYLDAERERVRYAPNLPVEDEPWRALLAQRLNGPVVLENDANAAGWGEYRFGSGRRSSSMVMVTVGTGIGGAVIDGGALRLGAHGMAAELGHLQVVADDSARVCGCGARGCWEMYGSGTALAADARDLLARGGAHGLLQRADGDPGRLTGALVAHAAHEGDPDALDLVQGVGVWIGRGLASVAAVLDPATIVLGGGVPETGSPLLESALRTYEDVVGRAHRPRAEVRVASLGDRAGILGAADLARARTAE